MDGKRESREPALLAYLDDDDDDDDDDTKISEHIHYCERL